MIILDTDHLSVFTDERDARHRLLYSRLPSCLGENRLHHRQRGRGTPAECGVDCHEDQRTAVDAISARALACKTPMKFAARKYAS